MKTEEKVRIKAWGIEVEVPSTFVIGTCKICGKPVLDARKALEIQTEVELTDTQEKLLDELAMVLRDEDGMFHESCLEEKNFFKATIPPE